MPRPFNVVSGGPWIIFLFSFSTAITFKQLVFSGADEDCFPCLALALLHQTDYQANADKKRFDLKITEFSHLRTTKGMNLKGKSRQNIGTKPAAPLLKLHLKIFVKS